MAKRFKGGRRMNDEVPKLDSLLSHRPLGRILEVDSVRDEFALIKRAFEAEGKGVPSAEDFQRVGRGCGTHLLKLNSSRAKIGQHVLRFVDAAANRHPELFPSVDAKKSQHCQLAFRPLEVAGHPTRSLVDHILNPDELSSIVTKAFSDVFGIDVYTALREVMTSPLPDITSLPVGEFPIIFLPRPGGGDLQATPLAPAQAYVRFGDVTEPYFRKAEDGAPRQPRGRWHKQFVADKPQNISSAAGKQRTRFFATMPPVLEQQEAEFYRFAQGGSFPLWRDEHVVEAVEGYTNLLDRSVAFSNQNIRDGLDQRATRLIDAARKFIEETLAEAKEASPGIGFSDPPKVTTVILRRRWPKDSYDRARRVLTGDHFKGRLEAEGES